MPNPTRIEINCATGEVAEIELTDAEVAELAYQAELAADAKAEEERVKAEVLAQKIAICEKLKLTLEEVEALIK